MSKEGPPVSLERLSEVRAGVSPLVKSLVKVVVERGAAGV